MTYKLLAIDVDGTLLRRDGSIHPDDAAAIARLRQGGVPVTIVTGRMYSGTCHVARSIALTGPIACVDGSHIVDLADDSDVYARPMVGAHASALRDILGRYRTARFVFARDAIIHDALGAPFAGYVRTWSPNIDLVDRLDEHPSWDHELGVMAVVAVGPEHEIAGAVRDLRAELSESTFVATFPVQRVGGIHAMVIRAAGPSKGTAIEWLARHHGCEVADVVAVGDWLNDVPMFEVAGRSFVMGQAPSAVKEAATDQLEADAHAGGGVAEAIRRAFHA